MARPSSYQPDGMRVARARTAAGLTQEELADRVHVHRVTIANIENGRARVSLELLERLSGELGKTREHLLGQPDQVDPVEAERERIAAALRSIGDGFETLNEVLDARVRDVGERRIQAALS